jgi:hypothetical protein
VAALRWVAWLTFLGLAIRDAVKNPGSVYFSPLEFVALAAAIGVSIWCVAKPLGPPKVEMTKPSAVRGTFVSRTSWGLVLFGSVLTIGGVAATAAMIYDVSTGRATFGDVLRDIGVFIEGWFVEIFTRGAVDAELEKTHAYALFLLLVPGIPLVWLNLIPFFNRGNEFCVDPGESVMVRRGSDWLPVVEYEYATVNADGTTITFEAPAGVVVLPQTRVFSRDYGCRLSSKVSAEFFRQRLTQRGFRIADGASGGDKFVATRAA